MDGVEVGHAPELPLGQAADERPELVVLGRGQGRRVALSALLELVCEQVFLQRRVEAGLEEREEEVEDVDRVCVF